MILAGAGRYCLPEPGRAPRPRHAIRGSVWTGDLQPPLFQGERAGKPLEIQDDGAAMSYSLMVACVSPGRAKASLWDVSPSPGTIPPLSSFLPPAQLILSRGTHPCPSMQHGPSAAQASPLGWLKENHVRGVGYIRRGTSIDITPFPCGSDSRWWVLATCALLGWDVACAIPGTYVAGGISQPGTMIRLSSSINS